MIKQLITSTLFFVAFLIHAQQEKVMLLEEQQGKRIILIAENRTQDSLSVFLRVKAEGFRRSADKPILKTLAPLSKTKMTTLIAIDGVPSSYTYDLIVNERLDNEVSVEYENELPDIEKVLRGRVVVFTKNDCGKCALLTAMLKGEDISFRSFNIDEDPVLYQQFLSFLEDHTKNPEIITFPVIWNKDHVKFGYEELSKTIDEIKG